MSSPPLSPLINTFVIANLTAITTIPKPNYHRHEWLVVVNEVACLRLRRWWAGFVVEAMLGRGGDSGSYNGDRIKILPPLPAPPIIVATTNPAQHHLHHPNHRHHKPPTPPTTTTNHHRHHHQPTHHRFTLTTHTIITESNNMSNCIIRFNVLQHNYHHHVLLNFHAPVVASYSTRRFHFNHSQLTLRFLRCAHSSDDPQRLSDPTSSSIEQQGESSNQSQGKSSEILNKLRRYGISGILSYGLLNTAYYLSAFLVAWFYIAPAPGKMGYWTAVKRFAKLMAMVWAGSQVTKLARLGGALALAPIVDKGLSWFMAKFKFKSQAKAFSVIVGSVLGLLLSCLLL
nr:fatty acid hydroxylase 1 [Tanacetum cinerariifolium]